MSEEQIVKLKDLKVTQLNFLLRCQNLGTTGNKAHKIAKLIEALGTDEVDIGELDEGVEESTLSQQVNCLQSLIQNLTETVSKLVADKQRLSETPVTEEPTAVIGTSAAEAAATGAVNSLPLQGNAATTPFPGSVENDVLSVHDGSDESAMQTRLRQSAQHKITDIIGVLPIFDPLKGHVTAGQFIHKVEQLRAIYAWTETEVLFSVQHVLKGVAKEWIDCQPVFQSWAQFVTMLLADFPSEVNIAEVHRDMGRRKRRPTETLKQFYYEMLNMGRKGGLDERSICSYIIAGLNDVSLTRTMSAMNIRSCAELLKSVDNMAYLNATQKTMPDIKQECKVVDGQPNEFKNVRCFNCNMNGHMAAKCPQPSRKPKCSKCFKFGHDAKTCKSERSSVAKIADGNCAAPPVMKSVKVSGVQLDAFVDTGSDLSLISEDVVPASAKREPAVKRLQGFGGGVVETTEITCVDIAMDSHDFLATLVIVPRKFMAYDLLIGRDVLCRKESRFIIEWGVMQVKQIGSTRFEINPELGKSTYINIAELLGRYETCFSEGLSGLGRCVTAEMDIKITTEKPIVGKRYQVPFAQRPALSSILRNLLDNDIIRPSSSPHAAPVVLVKKSNGEDRMCVDFRALNAVTEKKHYPMPVVEEQLMQLADGVYFTSLDLTSGYYQIPLKEECKPLTAFFTPEGLYEHNVMPFGLVNAPMVFQEVMMNLIRGLKHRSSIINYVDEVVIATKTVEEGLKVLEEFLVAIRGAGLTLRPSKCVFMATEVKFLGHVITSGKIQPGTDKTQCVTNFPRPTSATEIRQFLGLTGFFRKFVERYGIIASPLTNLLKRDEQFCWTEQQEIAFRRLKHILTSAPVLAMFDQKKEHEVHTDASSLGISGVLMQREANGVKPVHYFSRKCSTCEANYASHELEVLAIVESLERFRIYLLGTHFIVVTDCNAVATTKATTLLRPRIARWWLRLQEFDFKCVHKAGAQMSHVDSLSRAPVHPPKISPTVAESVMRIRSNETGCHDWVFAMQIQDEKLKHVVKILSGEVDVDVNDRKQYEIDYVIKDGRLFRQVGKQAKLVIPRAVRWRIVKACHDDVGHCALEKTLERLQKHFWFPRMRRYVKSYIASCESCCFNKVKAGKTESQLHVYEVTPLPFRTVFMDHLGPFPKSRCGNLYVLVVVCGFTKYVLLKAVKNTKTGPVVKALQEMMSIFGQPKRITTDRGTAYTSLEFQRFVDKYGLQHVKTAVRTPRANGQAERVNKTLLSALKCSTTNVKDWDAMLLTIQWTINSQRNSVTRFSPNELVFHFNPRDVAQNRLIQAVHDDESNSEDVELKWAEAAENIKRERQKWKSRYDQKHQKPKVYQVGDLVVTNYIPSATGTSHKLDPVYKGPYIITKVLAYDRYLVEDLPDSTITQRRYSGVLTADHLKPWCSLSPELDDNEEDDEGDSSETDDISGEAELSTPLVAR